MYFTVQLELAMYFTVQLELAMYFTVQLELAMYFAVQLELATYFTLEKLPVGETGILFYRRCEIGCFCSVFREG